MKVEILQVIEKLMSAYDLPLVRIEEPFTNLEKMDYGLRRALDPQFDWRDFGRQLLQEVPENTLVFAEDVFQMNYAFFRLPEQEVLFSVGPWTTGQRGEESRAWAKKYLGKEAEKAISEYYNGVRCIESNVIAGDLTAILSLLFPPEQYAVVKKHEFIPLNFRPDIRFFEEPSFRRDIPAAMIEQRYEAENRVLDAVSRGDIQAALAALEQLGRFQLEPRFQNPMRDQKNLAIVFNTLLRKSVERSNVHPYYIDEISSKYALRIENMATEAEQGQLIGDMVREYCLYVQKYSLRSYSPMVQKIINYINLNLDTQLSLKKLSAMCFISPSYLSYLFKQETGVTLTDYVNHQRIAAAAHLLERENLPIAQVAAQVGFLDENYFTRTFKKTKGVTPSAYRKQMRAR